jgi:hypothetical protein
MLDFIVFALEVLQDCGLLYDVVSKLLPFHIAISIDIDLLEQIGEVSNQSGLAVRQVHLPKFEMPPRNVDELRKRESILLALELLFEHVDRKFIEIESHICNHAFVMLLYAFVARPWREDGMNIEGIFT